MAALAAIDLVCVRPRRTGRSLRPGRFPDRQSRADVDGACRARRLRGFGMAGSSRDALAARLPLSGILALLGFPPAPSELFLLLLPVGAGSELRSRVRAP